MKFYTNAASPFCRKVDVTLRETGQRDQVTDVPAAGTPLAPGTMPVAANPIGKIPVLERDEGPALYDSRVICRYLDDRAKAGLYPESRVWDVLTLEATGDGICDAAVLMVYEARVRPEEIRFAPWVEAQWTKITRSLDALENRWMGLLNGPVNAGQIAVGCALGYIDFRHGGRDWRTGRPALTEWFANFSERPSMAATVPVA